MMTNAYDQRVFTRKDPDVRELHNGQLRIDFSSLVGMKSVLVVEPWHKGATWYLCLEDENEHALWHDTVDVSLNFPDVANSYWFQGVPEYLRQPLLIWDEQASELSFPLLWLASRHRSVRDLFISAPQLTALLLTHAIRHRYEENYVAILCMSPRIQILAHLGLPARKSALRLLSKIRYQQLSSKMYGLMHDIFTKTPWPRLNHLSYIDERMLRAACEKPELIGDELLPLCSSPAFYVMLKRNFGACFHSNLFRRYARRGASIDEMKEVAHLISDALSILNQLGRAHERLDLLRCNTMQKLQRQHDGLVEILNRQRGMADGHQTSNCWNFQDQVRQWIKMIRLYITPFPKPPISGTELIQHVGSYNQLLTEGRNQQNCVVSYYKRIIAGQYAVYRMLEPERATIGIRMDNNHCYSLDQVRLYRNQAPSAETLELIQQWLMNKN